jgi:hypothetical protein
MRLCPPDATNFSDYSKFSAFYGMPIDWYAKIRN